MLDLTQTSFAGHQTFALRFGWLPKGVRAIEKDPMAFGEDQAMVELGVGKNMVQAIRHWCVAAQLAEEAPRGQGLKLTELGSRLLSEKEGHDKYLEDPGSLWLIHWLISTNPSKATTWRWAFGYWSQNEFTREGILDELEGLLKRKAAGRASRTSLERDVEVFIHTYTAPQVARGTTLEETLDCPLVDLRLLRRDDISDRYSFIRAARPSLPNNVLAFAILDYWERFGAGAETMAFEALLHGEESPGKVFRMTETDFSNRLEDIQNSSKSSLTFDSTAGMRQLYRKKKSDKLAVLFPGMRKA